jgi:hypothetical protein
LSLLRGEILLVFFNRSDLIGRNFTSEMGRKKKRDQSDFFYGKLESEESEEEEFPPKKHLKPTEDKEPRN